MPARPRLVAAAVAFLFVPAELVGSAVADPLHGPASRRVDNPFRNAFENAFAETVEFAGDIDGDGDDELLVAAPFWNNRGRVALYLGTPSGLRTSPVVVPAPEDSFTFGLTLGSAGDVDADGFGDVVIGASKSAFVYYGSATGLREPVEIPLVERAYYGASVSAAGDVNADGYDDLLVGAGSWTGEFRNQGQVYVYLGSPSGLRETPLKIVGAQQAGAGFGAAVAPAGDVNRDGFDDIIVGAPGWKRNDGPREGRVYVYLGSHTGIRRPAWHVDPTNLRRSGFGSSIAPAGDVNRDGYDDIVLGVPGWSGGSERIYVYLGSRGGPRRPPITRHFTGRSASGFGRDVTGAGDLDRDGFDDIIVGAPDASSERYGEGRSFTFLGTAQGLTRRPLTRDPADKKNAQYGDALAGGGDVNGDGLADVAVAAPEHPVVHYRGRVYVYY